MAAPSPAIGSATSQKAAWLRNQKAIAIDDQQ